MAAQYVTFRHIPEFTFMMANLSNGAKPSPPTSPLRPATIVQSATLMLRHPEGPSPL